METEYRAVIVPVATAFMLSPRLVEAVVWTESRGRTDAFRYEPLFWARYKLGEHPDYKDMIARRASSSYGLMQIMYPTARDHGFRSDPEYLFLPKENLHWGCLHLRSLVDWAKGFTQVPSGDKMLSVLAAYNGGRGGNTPGSPLRPVNRQYALKVLAAYEELTGWPDIPSSSLLA